MNKLNSSDLEGLFAKIKDIMVENKENLFKLDSYELVEKQITV